MFPCWLETALLQIKMHLKQNYNWILTTSRYASLVYNCCSFSLRNIKTWFVKRKWTHIEVQTIIENLFSANRKKNTKFCYVPLHCTCLQIVSYERQLDSTDVSGGFNPSWNQSDCFTAEDAGGVRVWNARCKLFWESTEEDQAEEVVNNAEEMNGVIRRSSILNGGKKRPLALLYGANVPWNSALHSCWPRMVWLNSLPRPFPGVASTFSNALSGHLHRSILKINPKNLENLTSCNKILNLVH